MDSHRSTNGCWLGGLAGKLRLVEGLGLKLTEIGKPLPYLCPPQGDDFWHLSKVCRLFDHDGGRLRLLIGFSHFFRDHVEQEESKKKHIIGVDLLFLEL